MTQNNKNVSEGNDPYFDDAKPKGSLSFDYVLWFYRVLKYWYLFVISITICLALGYVKNKQRVDQYTVQALLMLEDRGGASVVAGAVPMGAILQNTENQQVVIESYGMAERTVKALPQKMYINYFTENSFKRSSLYLNTPIEVETMALKPEAYYYTYNIAYVDENHCRIYYEGDDKTQDFSIVVPYGKVIEEKRFKIKLNKSMAFKPQFEPFCFNFIAEGQLIGSYSGRIKTELKTEKSTALVLTMSGSDPAKDIDYLNAFLAQYEAYNLELKNKQANLTIAYLDKQLKIIRDSLNMSRHTLEEFQKETGLYEITSPSLRGQIDKAGADYDDLAFNEKALLIATQKINEMVMGDTDLIDPLSFGLKEAKLATFVDQYNALLKEARNLGPKNILYNKTVDELNECRTNILKELQLLQITLQEKKDELAKKYTILDIKIDNLPPQERELLKFERVYKLNEMYEQFLVQRGIEAEIQRSSNTPDNFVLTEPRLVGGSAGGGQSSTTYLYFFILGLIIPLGIIVLKEEVLNNKILTKEECERLSGLPVIGTIENISKKLANGVVLVKKYPKSSFAESFRNMRVRLEYIAQRSTNISVLVTSTEPGDGKTFVASNVASVYQLTGKKVVVVDLDLRRPSIAKTLEIDTHAAKGISNYLIGQVSLEEITILHPDYGFAVITAGTLPPNPSELIKTDKTKQLIEILKGIYDYVIIDCSPVGLVSDAYILSQMVDTTLFVVRRNKTNKSFFKSVARQLKADGIGNAAIVFNDVKGREGYYGTARYYGDRSYYLKKSNYYHDDYFEK